MKRKKHVWNMIMLALLTAAGASGLWGCAHGGEALGGADLGDMEEKLPETAEMSEAKTRESQSALLREKQQEAAIQENKVIFGSLEIVLPEGVEADLCEGREGDAGVEMELSGLEPEDALLPPFIRLECYEAEYEEEFSLAEALLEKYQEEEKVTLLKLEAEEDYSFQLKTEDWQCLILARESEVYLLWEIRAEEEFSISSLVEERRVRWTDTGEAIWYEESGASCMLAEPEEGRRLLFCSDLNEDGDNALFLYRCGEYEEPFQELDFDWLPGKEDFADIDSDGCLDLRLGRNELYIWDREKQRYTPAGTELAQYGLESAEREPEDEADGAYQIPQEFLDLIGRAFEEGTEYETLVGLRTDRELSEEEALALGEANPWIHAELAKMRNVYVGPFKGGFAVLEADLDNDGISDLLMGRDEGGSGGFFSYVLFKGKADGTYERTSQMECVREEFCVLSFEGENYLWLTTWDYGRKLYNGADLYYYENGELVEQASVRMVPESCQVNVEECQGEQWRALAEQAAAAGSEYQELAGLGESWKWTGSAEQQAAGDDNQTYLCDLNNDGTEEQYQKAVWLSSNFYTEDGLHFSCEAEGMEAVKEAVWSGGGRPMMLWVDEADGQNIIQVLSATGLYDYEISGYLVSGAEYERVYRITGAAEIGTVQHREMQE